MKIFGLGSKLAILATMALPVSVSAQAAKPCMTKDQLGGLVVTLLPAAMKQLQTTCKPNLPENAALSTLSVDKMTQFQTAATAARPKAAEALRIMMGNEVPEGVDGATMLPFIESMAVAGIAGEIKPEMCPMVNNMWSALAPLPPENWGELVAIFALIGMKETKGPAKAAGKKNPMSDLNICPYVAVGNSAKL